MNLVPGFAAACAAAFTWVFTAPEPSAPAAAQTGTPPTIFLDASVTDEAGRAVTTLGTRDFRVSIDEELRRVVSVRYVHRGPGADTAASLADPSREAPAAAERSRTLLLLIDENSVVRGQERPVAAAASKVLDELGPADQAAVASLPRPPSRIVITTEPAALQAALSRTAGRAVRDSVADASKASAPPGTRPPVTADSNPDAVTEDPTGAAGRGALEPEALGRRGGEGLDQADPEAGARGTLRALLSVVEGLRALPGLKSVCLFRQAASSDVRTAPATGGGNPSDVDAAIAAAARARTTIHVVVIGAPGRRQVGPDDDLQRLAAGTGGTMTLARDAADTRAFEGLRAALRGGYLVEIESKDGDRSPAAHSVKVEIARARTTVRAASWWTPRNDPVPAVAPPAASPGSSPAGGATRGRAAADPRLVLLLARVREYLEGYVRDFGNIVAEEEYQQQLSSANRSNSVLYLRSDVLLVKSNAESGWSQYRDVFEADGKPVRDRDDRVRRLFIENPAGASRLAREIADESARYNLGTLIRTINLPTLPLAYLSPARIGGMSFHLDGEETVDGNRLAKLAFKEVARPTLVRPTTSKGEIPAEGIFWVDPATGRIQKTKISAYAGTNEMTTTVVYRPAPGIGLWLPAEMEERYTKSGEEVTGRAVYRNFRSFTVSTDVEVKKE